jgi:hypothetical protein
VSFVNWSKKHLFLSFISKFLQGFFLSFCPFIFHNLVFFTINSTANHWQKGRDTNHCTERQRPITPINTISFLSPQNPNQTIKKKRSWGSWRTPWTNQHKNSPIKLQLSSDHHNNKLPNPTNHEHHILTFFIFVASSVIQNLHHINHFQHSFSDSLFQQHSEVNQIRSIPIRFKLIKSNRSESSNRPDPKQIENEGGNVNQPQFKWDEFVKYSGAWSFPSPKSLSPIHKR